MKPSLPAVMMLSEWQLAAHRAETYLKALGVSDPVHRDRIVMRLIERIPENSNTSPKTLVMDEMMAALDEWFGEWFNPSMAAAPHISVQGRVALLVSQLPQRIPGVVMAPHLPARARRVLKAVQLQPTPESHPTRMVPQPLMVNPLATEAWERLEGVVLLKIVGIIATTLGSLSLLFHLF